MGAEHEEIAILRTLSGHRKHEDECGHWSCAVLLQDRYGGVPDAARRVLALGCPLAGTSIYRIGVCSNFRHLCIMHHLEDSLFQRISRTSSNLPPDVRKAMGDAIGIETPGTQCAQALSIIATSMEMAEGGEAPICQDTGMPAFVNRIAIRKSIRNVVAPAARKAKLGPETPPILKGGGCGNKNIQYSPPCQVERPGRSDRDREGVKESIPHSAWQARGKAARLARSPFALVRIARMATLCEAGTVPHAGGQA